MKLVFLNICQIRIMFIFPWKLMDGRMYIYLLNLELKALISLNVDKIDKFGIKKNRLQHMINV